MHDRDAIIAAVDLRALADELLGGHSGGERNPTWRCPNPQHAQTGRTPPVSIFTSHRGERRWRCHGCGEGGTAIDLVMARKGIDLRGALDELARRVGQIPQPPSWQPPPRRQPILATARTGCTNPEGLSRYVTSCAEMLWQPEGRAMRDWLVKHRGLPEAVLRANLIGADLGPRRQPRPEGMCRTGGAVLPVTADGRIVYAQVRVLQPQPNRPRYLNPAAGLAPNPRLARYRPPSINHSEVIITEGTIDALSAASAGYRAVAVLSAGYPDRSVALALSRLQHPLVIAFDPDDAGKAGANRLRDLLAAELRPSVNLDLGGGDLNDALRQVGAGDWNSRLPDLVERATTRTPARDAPSLSR